ncbi:MAG: hypothetical protein WBC68_09835, partial [Albidovulum sp.]
FRFTDLAEQKDWWLIVESDRTEVCMKDPDKDVNIYFDCSVRTMCEVWNGDRTYRDAMSSGDPMMQGDPSLTHNVRAWLLPRALEAAPRKAAVA